ncbi:hypothetical protein PEC301899_05440 [Pectobacterium carotovorum subsp. carotovorum]|nr:hypothetical protein PEC301899_05440 [Pectobacterium carotovorum subsp. carotovorum]
MLFVFIFVFIMGLLADYFEMERIIRYAFIASATAVFYQIISHFLVRSNNFLMKRMFMSNIKKEECFYTIQTVVSVYALHRIWRN